MDDPRAMRLVERVGDLNREGQRLIERQRAFRQSLRERLAFEVLHDQIVDAVLVADVVKRADVRMVERSDRFGFALEPLAECGSLARASGRTLIATVRSRRVSRAL